MRLNIWDHDKTLAFPRPSAYESMVVAANSALRNWNRPPLTWTEYQELFARLEGAVESNLAETVCEARQIHKSEWPSFADNFYANRAAWCADARAAGKLIGGLYYSDAISLLALEHERPGVINVYGTGNPRRTMEQRGLALRPYFVGQEGDLKGAFGDEVGSRAEIYDLCIARANKEFGFEPQRDSLGFATNVCALADSPGDARAALEARIPLVLVNPRRQILDLQDMPRLYEFTQQGVFDNLEPEIVQAGLFGLENYRGESIPPRIISIGTLESPLAYWHLGYDVLDSEVMQEVRNRRKELSLGLMDNVRGIEGY